jgi:hypothetical protein
MCKHDSDVSRFAIGLQYQHSLLHTSYKSCRTKHPSIIKLSLFMSTIFTTLITQYFSYRFFETSRTLLVPNSSYTKCTWGFSPGVRRSWDNSVHSPCLMPSKNEWSYASSDTWAEKVLYVNNSKLRLQQQGLQSIQYWQHASLLCLVKYFTDISFEIRPITAFKLNFISHWYT